MNKYVIALLAMMSAPIFADCTSCKGEDLAKKVITKAMDMEKSCSCSSCSGCTSCGKCCCKSPEGAIEEEATTKCNCGKPKPKAEQE